MSDEEFLAFMDLLMCSDPWPIKGEDGVHAQEILNGLADGEARRRGIDNWIVAYHEAGPARG